MHIESNNDIGQRQTTSSAASVHQANIVDQTEATSAKTFTHKQCHMRICRAKSASRNGRQHHQCMCALGNRCRQPASNIGKATFLLDWKYLWCHAHIAQLTLAVIFPHLPQLVHIVQSLQALKCLHRPWPALQGKLMSGVACQHCLCPAHNYQATSGVIFMHHHWVAHNVQTLLNVGFPLLLRLQKIVCQSQTWASRILLSLQTSIFQRQMWPNNIIFSMHTQVYKPQSRPSCIIHGLHRSDCRRLVRLVYFWKATLSKDTSQGFQHKHGMCVSGKRYQLIECGIRQGLNAYS